MTVGSTADIAARLRAVLPLRWFPAPPAPGEAETAPILNALLLGMAAPLAGVYGLIQYVGQQTRLATTTGTNLELTAQDYFGFGNFPRLTGEADAAYAARIKAARLPQRATRPALAAALTGLTGQASVIVEPLNGADCKGYGSVAHPAAGGGYGYGVPGGLRYGSRLRPFQALVEVQGGRAVPATTVYATIANNLPIATIAWTEPAAS